MRSMKLLATLGLAAVLGALVVLPVASPASADTLQQAFRRWGQTFVVTSVSDAALDVDQRGAGSIVNFSDGGTDEYTFDQSSATFVNQLNLQDDLKVGNGTPDVTLNGEDAYVEGTLEVDGAARFDGGMTFTGEQIGGLTYASQAFTYTAAAGGTVPLFTIAANETWIVHDIKVQVTTNFDCTGDDCVVNIGDGSDPDGLCVLADATLQTADTEVTGYPAGWQCAAAATRGVYLDEVTTNAFTGGMIYDRAGTAETIDAVISASGNDLSAGAATVHIWYTRID